MVFHVDCRLQATDKKMVETDIIVFASVGVAWVLGLTYSLAKDVIQYLWDNCAADGSQVATGQVLFFDVKNDKERDILVNARVLKEAEKYKHDRVQIGSATVVSTHNNQMHVQTAGHVHKILKQLLDAGSSHEQCTLEITTDEDIATLTVLADDAVHFKEVSTPAGTIEQTVVMNFKVSAQAHLESVYELLNKVSVKPAAGNRGMEAFTPKGSKSLLGPGASGMHVTDAITGDTFMFFGISVSKKGGRSVGARTYHGTRILEENYKDNGAALSELVQRRKQEEDLRSVVNSELKEEEDLNSLVLNGDLPTVTAEVENA
jgi:hypothetical protein